VIALYHKIRPIYATAQHEPRQQQQQNLFVAEPQYQLAARVSSQPALECLIYTVRQQQIAHPFGKASADCMFATARILV